ncbi:MAG: TolC family protein, partial [Limisphaerales bacterium]
MNRKIAFAALLVLFAAAVRAAETDGRSATNTVVITSEFIARLMDEAQTNNPGQLAANSHAKAAAANVGSIRVWDDPMFMFGGSVYSPRGMDPAMMGDLTYGISEKLPLWGMPKLNRQVASAEMSTRDAQADYNSQQLRRDITKALFSAALAEEVVEIDEQDLVWLQSTVSAVDAKYRAGQTDAGDSLEIQNKVALRADQLQTDRLELSHDQFVLNRLLNRKSDSPWPMLQLPPVAAPVPFSEKLLSLALANEPQLKVMQHEIEQAKAAEELARRSRLPDISVGVQGNQYSGDGGFRSGMFTLSFPLPWGNAGKYRKDYEREKENEKAAEEDRADQMLSTHEMVHHLTIQLDAARRQALLYQNEISIRAAQALADKLAGWEFGHVTLQDVLDAHRDELSAQLMAARATSDQYQTLAELLLWTGQENFKSLTSLADESTAQNET